MGFKNKAIVVFLAASLLAVPASARDNGQRDSLVRLIKAKTIELIEKGGRNYRKSVDATFLHNGTYLICDTALWNVEGKVINAEGNVRLIQEGTILTSETMDYLIDQDLVQCRGGVVQLEDSKHNTLRTRYLDYNTKDSLAFFFNGASMRDSEGQIIESDDGSYDARAELFTFKGNVNMFTDSIFIKTSLLGYETAPGRANFNAPIDFWKDGNMLSAMRGWYLRPAETFFFTGSVHATSEQQEAWCDSLYFYRIPNDILMLGNAQVQDTTRDVAALANRIWYCDSLSMVKLSDEAAVALVTKEEQGPEEPRIRRDTLYMGADTLIYRTIPFCLIPAADTVAARERKADMLTDPVLEYRQKAAKAAAEAAAKAAQEAAEREGRLLPGKGTQGTAPSPDTMSSDALPATSDSVGDSLELATAPSDTLSAPADTFAAPASAVPADTLIAPADTLAAHTDTLAAPSDTLTAPADTAAAPADSIVVPADSTKIGFLDAKGNVRVFRYDIQVRCDSLRYNELDSVARLYINPIVWNEGNRQYSADSLLALVIGNRVDRVALESNAFVITQETPVLYDQIKATEIMAYFDSTAALRRFDGLGGANSIFFLKEKERFGTVNKVETKMMSAEFKDGNLDRIYYFDSPKNDVYPLAQLKTADRELKGFFWKPQLRPTGRLDITTLEVRPSEREVYDSHPRATFKQTDKYFPGYMKGVYQSIEDAKRRRSQRPVTGPEMSAAEKTLSEAADSLALSDSLAASADTLAASLPAPADTLSAADSLACAASSGPLTKAQQKALRRAEAERRRAERAARREARWAELDALDAAKAAEKAAKKQAREKARLAKQLERQRRQDKADEAKLQKYIARYQKKKAREDARAAAKAAKAAAKAAAKSSPAGIQETNLQTNGTDTEQISPLRSGGHTEQRGVAEPALHPKAAESSQTPLQGTQ